MFIITLSPIESKEWGISSVPIPTLPKESTTSCALVFMAAAAIINVKIIFFMV